MQPKPFIHRMARMTEALESEGRSQACVASHVAVPPLSNIASRMRVSAVRGNDNPVVSVSNTTSPKRLDTTHEERSRRTSSRTTPQPAAAPELPESSSIDEPPTTPTTSTCVSPQDEDERPRSLKRKRQPPKIFATPTSSAPSTPAHSQDSRATTPSSIMATPVSSDVSKKIRSLRLDNPVTNENLTAAGRPRLRSEARKLKAEGEQDNKDFQTLQAELAALRSDLQSEKRANSKLKAQASEDKQLFETLQAEFNALRSEYATKRCSSTEIKDDLVALRADIDLLRCGFEGELGGESNVSPETRGKLDKVIHMNEMLRRVLQGERIYNEQMRSKLHSLRKKVGPLMAKVDALQGTVDEMRAHFSTHDAPIELIMDFVRNFHQWWVDRYNARQEGGRSGDGRVQP